MLAVVVAAAASPVTASPAGAPSAADAATTKAGRIKIAVIPGIAINLDTSRVDALSQDLADALSSELEVDALGGLEVRRQLPPDGLPDECVLLPACTAEIAKTLGVTQLLFITLVNTGADGAVQMDTTWVDPSASKRENRPALALSSMSSAKERFALWAPKLMPNATVRRKSSDAPVVQFDRGKPRHFTVTSMVTAGITVAALGSGVAFALSTRSRYNDCDVYPYCKEGEKKSIRARGIAADASFAIALAGAITTAILWSTSAEAPRVMVSPTEDGAAITGMMRF